MGGYCTNLSSAKASQHSIATCLPFKPKSFSPDPRRPLFEQCPPRLLQKGLQGYQEGPTDSQKGPKGSQKAPNRFPEASKSSFWLHFGSILRQNFRNLYFEVWRRSLWGWFWCEMRGEGVKMGSKFICHFWSSISRSRDNLPLLHI